jgi:hypothetical protein
MKRTRRRLLDATLVLAGIAILFILLQAPPATTPNLPVDELHAPLWDAVIEHGKKSTEATCLTCHNSEQIPFTTSHPTGRRCLFCHRLSKK